MRILFVEDAGQLRKHVGKALRASGYAVDETGDGEDGLWMAQSHDYDVIILDIMLPNLDGISILQKLRDADDSTPVLFLTAKDRIEDRVHGLRKGADDYLVKPFDIDELLARVEVLCRRNYQKPSSTLVTGDVELDVSARTVRRAGVPVELPAREFALLEYLMLRESQVVSKREIEEHIYDDLVSPMSNVVESAVSSLRKRLTVSDRSAPIIHTKRGHGYYVENRGQL